MTTPALSLAALLGTLFLTSAVAAPPPERPAADTPWALAGLQRGGPLVKNLPYSAEVISERVQKLADGNEIVNKHSSFSYRDSAGRTRQEVRDDKGELRTVAINDKVAGVSYFLNVHDKVATRVGRALRVDDSGRARIAPIGQDGKVAPPAHGVVIRRSDDDADNVRVTVEGNSPLRIEAGALTMNGRTPRALQLGPLAGAFSDIKWARKAVTRELGARDIDGVRAEGSLRSYEIPAGELGNRNAIVVSDESWYAPALQITVLSKHSDPRSGEHTYRLAALKREEPAAALFAVPADYTVRDVTAMERPMGTPAPQLMLPR